LLLYEGNRQKLDLTSFVWSRRSGFGNSSG
jgi:hypothetical protein